MPLGAAGSEPRVYAANYRRFVVSVFADHDQMLRNNTECTRCDVFIFMRICEFLLPVAGPSVFNP